MHRPVYWRTRQRPSVWHGAGGSMRREFFLDALRQALACAGGVGLAGIGIDERIGLGASRTAGELGVDIEGFRMRCDQDVAGEAGHPVDGFFEFRHAARYGRELEVRRRNRCLLYTSDAA